MTEVDALELVQFAMWTVLTASGPAIAAAMLIGITISLFQALTQIQEITLTFVPKILAILAAVAFSSTYMGSQIGALSNVVFSRIENGF